MQTHIDTLVSQYRAAHQARNESREIFKTIHPQFTKAQEIRDLASQLQFALTNSRLDADALVLADMFLRFEKSLQQLVELFHSAHRAYKIADKVDDVCFLAVEAAKQALEPPAPVKRKRPRAAQVR